VDAAVWRRKPILHLAGIAEGDGEKARHLVQVQQHGARAPLVR
jgi:hypothetical protein